MRMHRRRGKDHRHRHPALTARLIGQHQMPDPGTHRILGFGPDPGQPGIQVPLARLKRTINGGRIRIEMIEQRLELRIADKGRIQHQNLCLAAVLVQHVLEVPEPRLEAHHPEFAQTVNRRVRDLRKILPEEMAERAILLGQHRRRRVIAHRRKRLLAVLRHRGEDLLQLFNRITRRNLTAAQFVAAEQRLFRHFRQRCVQFDDLADPIAKRQRLGQLVLDAGILEQLALFHVHRDHLTGAKRALLHHIRLVQRYHPGLGPGDQHAVPCHHIPHRTQPVPVQPGTYPPPIGHRQCGGAVPRLHHAVAIGIHVAPRLRQFHRLPGPAFGHQHRLGHRCRPSCTHQHLEHGIQRRRIRRPGGHNRFNVLGHVAKRTGCHADLVAFHPVEVALERVDLAVMRQHAEWLRQPPLREGVCGIALVIDRKGRFKPLVHQVGVKLRHLFGQHHALVDDRPARHRSNIKRRHPCGDCRLFDPAADDIQLALEHILIDALGIGNQDLLDLGPCRIGLFPQTGNINRHMPPAINIVPHSQNFGFHDRAAGLLRTKVRARQKHLPDRHKFIGARRMPGAAHLIIEKRHRDLHMDARAVAGHAIGVNRPPVPDRLERLDPVFNHRPAA